MVYLFVYNYVHFNTGFGPALEDSVETIILIKFAWPPKINFWRKPPVLMVGSYEAKDQWK